LVLLPRSCPGKRIASGVGNPYPHLMIALKEAITDKVYRK